jgi:hypothetical protein
MGGRGTGQDPQVAEWCQLVRWRQGGARRRGIACLVTCCPSPDCDCRELHIDAFEVDDRFDKITVRGEEIVVLHRVEPGGPAPRRATRGRSWTSRPGGCRTTKPTAPAPGHRS